jgi:hypothetical protein
MQTRLKRIAYRGGIAKFDIPFSWKEEYEPSGGATFYEDRPDSGTLRLNVLSFSSNGNETGDQMVAGLIANGGYHLLRDGLAIRKHVEPAEENGEQLQLHYWDVAVPIEGCSARLAIFSYTILASQENDPLTQHSIELLDRSIRAAEYSREQGVTGDYQHE